MVATGQGILGNNMFAYCLNNPVIHADHSGMSTSGKIVTPIIFVIILDDGCGGGAGGGGGGGGGISPTAILITMLDVLVQAVRYSSINSRNGDDDAIYYGVDIFGGNWKYITPPMDFDEASDWATRMARGKKYNDRTSWGLYTENEDDALSMAVYLGRSAAITHDEKEKGHYAHFHTAFRQIYGFPANGFHMWYGEKGE